MKNPELVILAAGMGSRYGGLKQIDKIDGAGHIIIDYSIFDAIRAGFRDFTFIIKKAIERDFRKVMDEHLKGKDVNVKYVYQELDMLPNGYAVPDGRRKPWGTAHAILCCRGVIDAPFAVINADDYYGRDAFAKIYDFLKSANGDRHYAMIGYRVGNTVTDQGTVSRGVCKSNIDGRLTEIVERTAIGTRDGEIYYTESGVEYPLAPDTLVSMNLWGFTPDFIDECNERFADFLDENLADNPEKCEFYIPTVVSELISEGMADVRVINSVDKWYGVTYKEDKPAVTAAFNTMLEDGIYPKDF